MKPSSSLQTRGSYPFSKALCSIDISILLLNSLNHSTFASFTYFQILPLSNLPTVNVIKNLQNITDECTASSRF